MEGYGVFDEVSLVIFIYGRGGTCLQGALGVGQNTQHAIIEFELKCVGPQMMPLHLAI